MGTVLEGINIKRDFQIENGAHILYLFENQNSYIENLIAYVTDGIALGHLIVIVDYPEVYHLVLERISVQFSEEDLKRVLFDDSRNFYGADSYFHAESIVEHFEQALSSLHQSDCAVLTWGRVTWREQKEILSKIERYERIVDNNIKGKRLVSVCAYDGEKIDGNLLVKLQQSHEYFMTDKKFIQSALYGSDKAAFPSLAIQSKIESELDLYKSKLDFAHVVSHEVRNPLTIINGYANIIRNTELNLTPDSVDKLVSIGHYVAAIDQELAHIIETENILAEDLYMRLESINPLPTVHHVIETMKIKSVVQNINFTWSIDDDSRYLMLGNPMGIRLILSNAISNAIKYSDERGTVEFHTNINNNQIRFTICDNGTGMSGEQLKSLHQKYAKFDDSRSGQGIGLYIVKNLTDRFNGQIHYESELEHGTTVTIEFPLLNERFAE